MQSSEGKPDKPWRFLVSYSFHCFCKDYEHQSEEEKKALMYFAPKDARPFCRVRYLLAKKNLRTIVESLGVVKVIHAGYGNYAVAKIVSSTGVTEFYFVPFNVFREHKRLRLHITSAYPITQRPKGKPVSFFKIAHNLISGKPLPHP